MPIHVCLCLFIHAHSCLFIDVYSVPRSPGHACTFEDGNSECQWTWDSPDYARHLAGFEVTSGQQLRGRTREGIMKLPGEDSSRSQTGEYGWRKFLTVNLGASS